MVDPTRTSDSSRIRNDDSAQQEQPKPKAGPSSFDEILKQGRSTQTPQQQQSSQQGNAVLQREQARDSRPQENREKNKDDKTESRDESHAEEDSRRSEGPTEGRVEAKGQQKDREGGGQGQGQFGGGRGAMTREAAQSKSKENSKAAGTSQTQGAFAAELKKAAKPDALNPQHIQQIVNKVVQFFRVKKLTSGDTELDIGFHDEIFKGLRLRLVQKDGKVALHILSDEGDVRRLFEKSRQSIEDALTSKGVKLSQIVIEEG